MVHDVASAHVISYATPHTHTRRRKPRKTTKPRASRGVSHYNLVRKSYKLSCTNSLY